MLKLKSLTVSSEDVEQLKLSHIDGGNIKWYSHLRTLIIFLLKLDIHLPHNPLLPCVTIYLSGIRTFVYEWHIIMSYGFIHNSQKLETTQTSINKTMDKRITVYPFNGVLLSKKSEQTVGAQRLISQTLCWEEKASIKKHTLYFFDLVIWSSGTD